MSSTANSIAYPDIPAYIHDMFVNAVHDLSQYKDLGSDDILTQALDQVHDLHPNDPIWDNPTMPIGLDELILDMMLALESQEQP